MRLLKLRMGRSWAAGRRAAVRGRAVWGALAVFSLAVAAGFVALVDSVAAQAPAVPYIDVDLSVSIDEKADGVSGRVEEGEKVKYVVVVTNTGNVALDPAGVVLSLNGADVPSAELTCTPALTALAVHASATCEGERLLAADDFTNGAPKAAVWVFEATASGTPPGGDEVTDVEREEVLMSSKASITLEKTAKVDMTVAGSPNRVEAGDTITYAYTVTNGPVAVKEVTVTDGGATITSCSVARLAAGQSKTCEGRAIPLDGDDITAGQVSWAAAKVRALPPGRQAVEGTSSAGTTDLRLDVEWTVSVPSRREANGMVVGKPGKVEAGEVVTYTAKVTNTGSAAMNSVGWATDPKVNGVAFSCNVASDLAAGASTTCQGTHTLVAADFTNGDPRTAVPRIAVWVFEATATGTPTTPANAAAVEVTKRAEVPMTETKVVLTKTAKVDMTVVSPNNRVDVGDKIKYTFTVANIGPLAAKIVSVEDVHRSSYLRTDDTNVGTNVRCDETTELSPGEWTTCKGEETLEATDITAGRVLMHHAKVKVKLGRGRGEEEFEFRTPKKDNEAHTSLRVAPNTNPYAAIEIDSFTVSITNKEGGTAGKLEPGDKVAFKVEATNIGNVDLVKPLRADMILNGAPMRAYDDNDDLTRLGGLNCPPPAGSSWLRPVFKPRQFMKCSRETTLTAADLDALGVPKVASWVFELAVSGSHAWDVTEEGNTVRRMAQVTARSAAVMVPTAPAPITLTRTAAVDMTAASQGSDSRVDKGDTITYTYKVRNDGDLTVTDVKVTEGDVTFACGTGSLAPGVSRVCPKTITLTQPQVDDGRVPLAEATATAALTGRSVTDTVAAGTGIELAPAVKAMAASAGLTVVKRRTAPEKRVSAGDEVGVEYTVTNTGNVTLSQISVSDRKGGDVIGDVICPATAVAPGDLTTCRSTYTVTDADIKAAAISSVVEVTAKPPLTGPGVTVVSGAKISLPGQPDSPSGQPDPPSGQPDPPSGQPGSSSGQPGSSSGQPGSPSGQPDSSSGRLAGADRYATAAVISKETFKAGVAVVYVATGANYPDALAGSAASGGDGPILLVTKDSIPGASLAELKRLKPKRIVVLGGAGVVSAKVEIALGAHTAGSVSRLAGADRYATAADISAEHFKPGAAVAFVATGADFPDALAGGPAAAKAGGPILLTQKDKLPAATVSELKRLKPKRIVVLGGAGVVSAEVDVALAAYTGGKVSRLAGADRYRTAAAISKDGFGPGAPVVYVATGLNFPDALAGGAAGALYEGPVLLVAGSSIPKATQDELTRLKPKSIVVLGGTAVVSQKVQDDLKAYLP